MEVILGIVIVAALVLFTRWRNGAGRAAPEPATLVSQQSQPGSSVGSLFRVDIDQALLRDSGRLPQPAQLRQVPDGQTTDHVPPNPTGDASTAWSPRTRQLEVAGEWYQSENLRALFRRHSKVSENGAEIQLPAVLVPDPSNPFDDHAVAVFVDGLHVGYMERADARRYHASIAGCAGRELEVPSRQWLRGSIDDTWARVTLSLPGPEDLQCPNPSSDAWVLLPPGSTVQVTREEEYLEHLRTLLSTFASETVVAATLRSVLEQRPRSVVELVAVDINGGQVGFLTVAQTANYLPLVHRAESEGLTLACRASLRGNSLKADVALHACKAHDLNDQELEQLFAAS